MRNIQNGSRETLETLLTLPGQRLVLESDRLGEQSRRHC
jgi:hypothetical protein